MTEAEVKALLATVLQDLAKKIFNDTYSGDFNSTSVGDAAYRARMVMLLISSSLESVAADLISSE